MENLEGEELMDHINLYVFLDSKGADEKLSSEEGTNLS